MCPEEMRLWTQLREASFAMDELRLYLDTHWEEPGALALWQQYRLQRQNALEELALRDIPVNADGAMSPEKWTWTEGPWPWEGEV